MISEREGLSNAHKTLIFLRIEDALLSIIFSEMQRLKTQAQIDGAKMHLNIAHVLNSATVRI